MRHGWIFALLLLTGCQHLALPGAETDGLASSIWPLWERYRQCRTATDPDRLRPLHDELEGAMRTGIDPPGWIAALGIPVMRHPVRTAVDPLTLAADCTLRTAARFADLGDHDEARRLYRQFLLRYQSEDMAYYRTRARAELRHLDALLVVQEIVRDEKAEDARTEDFHTAGRRGDDRSQIVRSR